MYSTEPLPKIFASDIARLRHSPFRLIQFAKKILYGHYLKRKVVIAFGEQAGQPSVLRYHQDETPEHLVEQIVATINKHFEVVEGMPT